MPYSLSTASSPPVAPQTCGDHDAAVVIAMTIMFVFSPKISAFIHKHPTLKMLALSFPVVMIGLSLAIEG